MVIPTLIQKGNIRNSQYLGKNTFCTECFLRPLLARRNVKDVSDAIRVPLTCSCIVLSNVLENPDRFPHKEFSVSLTIRNFGFGTLISLRQDSDRGRCVRVCLGTTDLTRHTTRTLSLSQTQPLGMLHSGSQPEEAARTLKRPKIPFVGNVSMLSIISVPYSRCFGRYFPLIISNIRNFGSPIHLGVIAFPLGPTQGISRYRTYLRRCGPHPSVLSDYLPRVLFETQH